MSEYCQPSARFEMSGISPVGHIRGANVAKLATPSPALPHKGGGSRPSLPLYLDPFHRHLLYCAIPR